MSLNEKIAHTVTLLEHIAGAHPRTALANSLGAEDMVLTDLIARHVPAIGLFTLDTGRLNDETYTLLDNLRERYPALKLDVFYPDTAAIETWVRENGVNAFYRGVAERKACCAIRKVIPLRRALSELDAWITGMRRAQSVTRADLPEAEWDEGNGLQKYNPLADWTEKEVWEYIRVNDVPYNALHDKFYPSIGCAPCTRAISMGEDVRAGRWWWEDPASKECGLHIKQA